MGRIACAVPIVLFIIACAVVLAASVFRPAPLLVFAMESKLPGGDTVTYGWTSNYVYSPLAIGYAEYYSFIEWKHGAKTQRYCVFRDDHPLHSPHGALEMRASRDNTRVWLVETNRGKICASLDRNTGEFRDLLGGRIDPALPLREQAEHASGDSSYPRWATAKGGELLAAMSAQDYARIRLRRGPMKPISVRQEH